MVGILECDVGITEYVSVHAGFIGVLKSRFSDFHVNEIDIAGLELVLTDLTVPQPPNEVIDEEAVAAAKASLIELVQQDVVDAIARLSEAQQPKAAPADGVVPRVDIDVTAMDKATRTRVHNLLKQAFPKKLQACTCNETAADAAKTENGDQQLKKFIRIQTAHGKRESRRWPFPAENVHFLVYKENKDTNEVASTMADRLHMHPSCVSYAGTKDKRAKTTQKFCVKKRLPSQIFAAVRHMTMVHVGNFQFSKNTLKLGDLQGNRFHIALRHVKGERAEIEIALENVKERGFINYFGMQRFGNCPEAPTHTIGIAILKGDYKAACELIMKPRSNDQPFMRRIRQHWWDTRDAESTLTLFRFKNKTIEMKLLEGLKNVGNTNYANAMGKLPRNIILMYLHATQSLMYNIIASRRFKEFGLQLMAGDLVYRNRNEGDPDIVDDELEGQLLIPCPEADTDDAPGTSNSTRAKKKAAAKKKQDAEESNEAKPAESTYKNMVKALSADDIASGEYTIFDLVLPLPGHDVKFPENVVGQWYVDLLAEHGLTLKSFEHRVKSYALGGTYRKVLVKPKDLNWQFCQYDDHGGPLILSDWERLRPQHEQMLAIREAGKFQALILEFSLPSSSYATMLLRELLKMDTSKANQILLEQREVQNVEGEGPVGDGGEDEGSVGDGGEAEGPVGDCAEVGKADTKADDMMDVSVPSDADTEKLIRVGDGIDDRRKHDEDMAMASAKRKADGDGDIGGDIKKLKTSPAKDEAVVETAQVEESKNDSVGSGEALPQDLSNNEPNVEELPDATDEPPIEPEQVDPFMENVTILVCEEVEFISHSLSSPEM